MSQLSLQEMLCSQAAERGLLEQAKEYVFEYQDGVFERPPFPSAEALAGLAAFDEPMPPSPCDPAEMLRLLHTRGSPASVATTGGRFYGLVTGGIIPPVIAAKWLADAWDQLAALFVTSPVAAKLEALCQQWLVDLFQLPGESVAGLVSGTSMATLCGLAAGRHELLRRAGWDVN